MDSEQLYSSASSLLKALNSCDVIAVLQSDLKKGAAVSALSDASSRYLESASGFSSEDLHVAHRAGLDELQSPSYWFDLDTGTAIERQIKKNKCLRKLIAGRSFLARLAGLVEKNADPSDLEDNDTEIKLRLVDASEPAASPDRISRLIDGVDLIYRACAQLAQLPQDGLHLQRVGGRNGRTIVFSGDVEPATATRRIISAAGDIASDTVFDEHYSADDVADRNPFMHALDELFRIGALAAEDAESIRQGVLSGSIMVLECGASLCGADAADHLSKYSASTAPSVEESVDTDDELQYMDLTMSQARRDRTAVPASGLRGSPSATTSAPDYT